ncbi:MAG TPA: DUF1080 domain-containing protein [Prolixibacteraceae bacterium]|nr:DUF1080 domain-containing protein [Prolixibacteraceae bacterium]
MKTLLLFSTLSFLSITAFSQKQLFNGKNLKNWEIFLGSPVTGFEDLAKKATPSSTYQVIEMDGGKVIRISGDINASLTTKAEYGNYHLRLEFKWGEKVYGRRNSGLLYHSYGPFGAAFGTWMANIEHQLMHDNLGDTYLMANTWCETKVKKGDDGKTFFYNPEGQATAFSETDNGRSIKKMKDAEEPLGEWNTVDLYCFGQTAIHVVNGQVVMVNTNCSKLENGQKIPLTKGKIQLQSEGGEFFIRKVEIEKIKGVPASFIQ